MVVIMTAALVKVLNYHFMGDAIARLIEFDPMKIKNVSKSQPIALNLVKLFAAVVQRLIISNQIYRNLVF